MLYMVGNSSTGQEIALDRNKYKKRKEKKSKSEETNAEMFLNEIHETGGGFGQVSTIVFKEV